MNNSILRELYLNDVRDARPTYSVVHHGSVRLTSPRHFPATGRSIIAAVQPIGATYEETMPTRYIDLHTHLLPQVDDGPATIEDSLAMLDWYATHNFGTIVATPHIEADITPSDLEHRRYQFEQLLPEAEVRSLTILLGGENRLDPQLLDVAQNAPDTRLITYPNTNYILVDFPSFVWPFYAENALFRLQTMGYTPVFAHPERHPLPENKAHELVDRGIVLQVILGSFAGIFGSDIRRSTEQLLDSGIVHLLATDSHGAGARMKASGDALHQLRERIGDEAVDEFIIRNPTRILNNESVSPVRLEHPVTTNHRRFPGLSALNRIFSNR